MKFALSFIALSFVMIAVLWSCKPKATAVNGISYKNIEIGGLQPTIKATKGLVLLDVRTPEETAQGVISNDALKLDFYGDNFETELNKLDKNKSYLVYCRSGGRSAKAAQKMINLGFTKVTNLKGGYKAFSKSNQ